ncbi:hypothetical protein T492DRAFT_897601 [Pavlovales sp. CCMP2436]|nr:hypothetical protein T492DRAFT_897601 [Pavlovales sp. CCMP2436]
MFVVATTTNGRNTDRQALARAEATHVLRVRSEIDTMIHFLAAKAAPRSAALCPLATMRISPGPMKRGLAAPHAAAGQPFNFTKHSRGAVTEQRKYTDGQRKVTGTSSGALAHAAAAAAAAAAALAVVTMNCTLPAELSSSVMVSVRVTLHQSPPRPSKGLAQSAEARFTALGGGASAQSAAARTLLPPVQREADMSAMHCAGVVSFSASSLGISTPNASSIAIIGCADTQATVRHLLSIHRPLVWTALHIPPDGAVALRNFKVVHRVPATRGR